ncbi:MAG: hypothetical protein EOP50_17710 [Sphingobacteriales bacterium]|nr:MAG: hypothetical protein EOP50_17710 [Sphingobacteriales bacterium]
MPVLLKVMFPKAGTTYPPVVPVPVNSTNPNKVKNEHFEGEISEVSIWDIARSEREIAAMDEVLFGNEKGLRGYWNFKDVKSTTTTTTTSTSSNQAYAPAEGDVTRRNGKVMVYRSNTWVSADRDMTGDNGVTISRSGSVTREGKTVEIQEGETVNRSGSFWDKTGNAVSNAWDDTKHGVKKAGKAVGNAAQKVGHEVKDAVTPNHN